jgi:signal transduction histidine kinase
MPPDSVHYNSSEGAIVGQDLDRVAPIEHVTRMGDGTIIDSEPERARRTLSGGVLGFRWVAFAWMALSNIVYADSIRRPVLAWGGIAAAGLWTSWLTLTRHDQRAEERAWILWFDLALSVGLILISGLVVKPLEVTGPRLFYATAYPLSTALAWGAARGLRGALEVTVGLGTALVLSRPINGTPLASLTSAQIISLGNGLVNFLLAGGAAGVVSSHLDRSAAELRTAIDEAVRARERAARLSERESLGRAIHDSVLQSLALVHKQGQELAQRTRISPQEVLALANMAAEQEETLRALIMREPQLGPGGTASLRSALETVSHQVSGVPVTISAVGPLWLPAQEVDELVSAVRQALENVVEHAQAARAAIFAEADEGWVIVSVRDDGQGFVYDEDLLQSAGKAGMVKSMKGRISELGGRMRVMTAPGAGTEVEFRVPHRVQEAGDERRTGQG